MFYFHVRFFNAQVMISVRIDVAVLQVCKFMQCHYFADSKRKLVIVKVSEVHVCAPAVQCVTGASSEGRKNTVLQTRSSHLSFGTSMLAVMVSHLLPFSLCTCERENSQDLF